MTWSYSGDPSKSSLDKVRFLCGDTQQDDPYLQDEEINFLIQLKTSEQAAVQEACATIMAQLARAVDYALGPEKVTASKRFEQYQQLMVTRRSLWIAANAAPTWEGSNPDDSSTFSIGMHDDYGDWGWARRTRS